MSRRPLPAWLGAHVRLRPLAQRITTGAVTAFDVTVNHRSVGRIVQTEHEYWQAFAPDGHRVGCDAPIFNSSRPAWALVRFAFDESTLPDVPAGPPSSSAAWIRALTWSQGAHAFLPNCLPVPSEYMTHNAVSRAMYEHHLSLALLSCPGWTGSGVVPQEAMREAVRAAMAACGRLGSFHARYERLHGYVRDVLPGWQHTGDQSYADNSTEAEYRSARFGWTRRRLVVAPHGDRCF